MCVCVYTDKTMRIFVRTFLCLILFSFPVIITISFQEWSNVNLPHPNHHRRYLNWFFTISLSIQFLIIFFASSLLSLMFSLHLLILSTSCWFLVHLSHSLSIQANNSPCFLFFLFQQPIPLLAYLSLHRFILSFIIYL